MGFRCDGKHDTDGNVIECRRTENKQNCREKSNDADAECENVEDDSGLSMWGASLDLKHDLYATSGDPSDGNEDERVNGALPTPTTPKKSKVSNFVHCLSVCIPIV